MDYDSVYKKLMISRKDREILDGVYYEIHHIIPRSEGGTNEKTNLVHLTPREHYIAHLLLWKAAPKNMRRFWPLQWFYDKHRVRIPSRIIQMIKEDRQRFVNTRDYTWMKDPAYRCKASLITRSHLFKDYSYRTSIEYKSHMSSKTKDLHKNNALSKPTKNKSDGQFTKQQVSVDGVVYTSITSAAKAYNISIKAAYNRFNKDTWPNWQRI